MATMVDLLEATVEDMKVDLEATTVVLAMVMVVTMDTMLTSGPNLDTT